MSNLTPEQHIRLEMVKLYASLYNEFPMGHWFPELDPVASWVITGQTVVPTIHPNAPQEPAESETKTEGGDDTPETLDAHEAETSGDEPVMHDAHLADDPQPPKGEGWVAWTPEPEPYNLDGIEEVWFAYDPLYQMPMPTFNWNEFYWTHRLSDKKTHITHIKLKEGFQLVDGQVVPTWEWDPKNPTMPPWSRVWTGGKQPVANDVRVVALMRDGEIFYDHDANTWLVSWENSITEWATLDPADMPEEREV